MKVELKPIPGFPSYAAGSDGHIWRVTRPRNGPFAARDIPFRLKGVETKYGYIAVRLYVPKLGGIMRWVHRLVALAFHGAPDGRMDAAHKNHVRHDNRPENLEWASRKANMLQSAPRLSRGEHRAAAKLSAEKVAIIRASDKSQAALAREFGVSQPTISGVIHGKGWKHV